MEEDARARHTAGWLTGLGARLVDARKLRSRVVYHLGDGRYHAEGPQKRLRQEGSLDEPFLGSSEALSAALQLIHTESELAHRSLQYYPLSLQMVVEPMRTWGVGFFDDWIEFWDRCCVWKLVKLGSIGVRAGPIGVDFRPILDRCGSLVLAVEALLACCFRRFELAAAPQVHDVLARAAAALRRPFGGLCPAPAPPDGLVSVSPRSPAGGPLANGGRPRPACRAGGVDGSHFRWTKRQLAVAGGVRQAWTCSSCGGALANAERA